MGLNVFNPLGLKEREEMMLKIQFFMNEPNGKP